MSRFLIGNLFLLLSMICATSSQILLKAVIDDVQPSGSNLGQLQAFLEGGKALRTLAALSLLVLGFAFWVLCLVRLDLSYAYPIACASILFVTFFSVVFLGEPVTARVWGGTVLVVVGIILLMPSK